MIKVGITGGIGSGKSVVSRLLRVMGYPVFDTDLEAKRLMTESHILRGKLIEAFGCEAYLPTGELNRPYLASLIFNDRLLLLRMNGIVHPEVRKWFIKWCDLQKSKVVFFETAILFESDFYRFADVSWVVTAPIDVRISRIIARDCCSEEEAGRRIAAQRPQEENVKLAQVEIRNDGVHPLIPQILDALKELRFV